MADKLHHMPRLGMSEAQRLFGFTARALRFYEEAGLLRSRRDRLNHRFFEGGERRRLRWIAALRAADLSIPDIREVLDAVDTGDAGKVALAKLTAQQTKLRAQLAVIEAQSRAIAEDGDVQDPQPCALRTAA